MIYQPSPTEQYLSAYTNILIAQYICWDCGVNPYALIRLLGANNE